MTGTVSRERGGFRGGAAASSRGLGLLIDDCSGRATIRGVNSFRPRGYVSLALD